MMNKGKQRAAGLSLPELLVVISIIAIMAVVAVPAFSRLGMFSRSELRNTARTVHSMLKAARIYAATYRVDTAVVYVMDNWVDPLDTCFGPDNTNVPGLAAPVMDSVSGQMVRVLRAAAIMYAYPRDPYKGDYVSMHRPDSVFQEFPGRMVIPFFMDDEYLSVVDAGIRPRLEAADTQVGAMGLKPVKVWIDGGPYTGDPCGVYAWMPAHVFQPSGQLAAGDRERYVILVAPSPNESPDLRLVNPEGERTLSNLMHIPIEIYRATGRVKVAS